MKPTRTSVFIVTFVLGWFFFGWFGDFNLYVVNRDGSRWVKDYTDLPDRLLGGFVLSLIFSLAQVESLWLWQRLQNRTKPQRG